MSDEGCDFDAIWRDIGPTLWRAILRSPGLVFRIAKEPPVSPVATLILITCVAAATSLVVTAAALPSVRIVRQPELLRSE